MTLNTSGLSGVSGDPPSTSTSAPLRAMTYSRCEALRIGAHSWAHFFLKHLLSHPVVTAVIPGTSNPDNLGAERGPIPDAAMRRRMADFIDALPAA